MRRLATAISLIQNRGYKNTFWYYVRRFYAIRSSRHRSNIRNVPRHPPVVVTDGANLEYLHPSMMGVSEAIWLYGVHEPVSSEIYLEHVRLGDHVIEIGANIGYYVSLAHKATGDSGKILGFEPVPENYEVLRKNVEGRENILISPMAISNQNGNVEFFISDVPNWGSLIYSDGLKMTGKVLAESIRLDEYLANIEDFQPDLIHMDIEGGEIAAIEGAWQTIAHYKPTLMIEFHPFATGYDPIKAILKDLLNLSYDGCTLIDRQLDEPWIPDWLRRLRKDEITIGEVIQNIDKGKCSPNFTLLIRSPETVQRSNRYD